MSINYALLWVKYYVEEKCERELNRCSVSSFSSRFNEPKSFPAHRNVKWEQAAALSAKFQAAQRKGERKFSVELRRGKSPLDLSRCRSILCVLNSSRLKHLQETTWDFLSELTSKKKKKEFDRAENYDAINFEGITLWTLKLNAHSKPQELSLVFS